MVAALRTQFFVIGALVVRGMQNAGGKNIVYGYAWTYVQPLVMIVFFRLGQMATGLMPSGMPPTLFLVQGVMIVILFINTLSSGMKGAKRGLCVIPRIKALDLFVAQSFAAFLHTNVMFWLFGVPVAILEHAWPPENPLGVETVLIFTVLLGTSIGYVFSAIARVFPPITEFRKIMVRTLRTISGMFFLIVQLPTWTWPYLSWNPLLHLCELMRSYWFTIYTTPIGSLPFVMECTFFCMLLGLSVDRYNARVLE